jgi:putative ABC transport system permease protein
MQDYIDMARSTRRFTMLLAAAVAVVALTSTCVGVYGVLAYAVAHRRHELGVRRALGADTTRIAAAVLREGIGFAFLGSALGGAGALVSGELLRSQLYAVDAADPASFGAAVALIVAGSVVACGVPAWRAVTVSPMDALRCP